jgi:hypothetical protein
MKGQPSSSAQIAQRNWMLENSVADSMDTIFKYDKEEQQMIRNVKPWEKDPHYFKVLFIFNFYWVLEECFIFIVPRILRGREKCFYRKKV